MNKGDYRREYEELFTNYSRSEEGRAMIARRAYGCGDEYDGRKLKERIRRDLQKNPRVIRYWSRAEPALERIICDRDSTNWQAKFYFIICFADEGGTFCVWDVLEPPPEKPDKWFFEHHYMGRTRHIMDEINGTRIYH